MFSGGAFAFKDGLAHCYMLYSKTWWRHTGHRLINLIVLFAGDGGGGGGGVGDDGGFGFALRNYQINLINVMNGFFVVGKFIEI